MFEVEGTPARAKDFTVTARIPGGSASATAVGPNKKLAKRFAAELLLRDLGFQVRPGHCDLFHCISIFIRFKVHSAHFMFLKAILLFRLFYFFLISIRVLSWSNIFIAIDLFDVILLYISFLGWNFTVTISYCLKKFFHAIPRCFSRYYFSLFFSFSKKIFHFLLVFISTFWQYFSFLVFFTPFLFF